MSTNPCSKNVYNLGPCTDLTHVASPTLRLLQQSKVTSQTPIVSGLCSRAVRTRHPLPGRPTTTAGHVDPSIHPTRIAPAVASSVYFLLPCRYHNTCTRLTPRRILRGMRERRSRLPPHNPPAARQSSINRLIELRTRRRSERADRGTAIGDRAPAQAPPERAGVSVNTPLVSSRTLPRARVSHHVGLRPCRCTGYPGSRKSEYVHGTIDFGVCYYRPKPRILRAGTQSANSGWPYRPTLYVYLYAERRMIKSVNFSESATKLAGRRIRV